MKKEENKKQKKYIGKTSAHDTFLVSIKNNNNNIISSNKSGKKKTSMIEI